MTIETKTFGFDGSDEIIYSKSFIVYEGKLRIDFLDKKFVLIFEKTEPFQDQKDVDVIWSGNEASVTFSKKFRNSLGSGTTNKIPILKTKENKFILFSIFGQQFGGDGLHITINFYIK